jgi:hypothetical protein
MVTRIVAMECGHIFWPKEPHRPLQDWLFTGIENLEGGSPRYIVRPHQRAGNTWSAAGNATLGDDLLETISSARDSVMNQTGGTWRLIGQWPCACCSIST